MRPVSVAPPFFVFSTTSFSFSAERNFVTGTLPIMEQPPVPQRLFVIESVLPVPMKLMSAPAMLKPCCGARACRFKASKTPTPGSAPKARSSF